MRGVAWIGAGELASKDRSAIWSQRAARPSWPSLPGGPRLAGSGSGSRLGAQWPGKGWLELLELAAWGLGELLNRKAFLHRSPHSIKMKEVVLSALLHDIGKFAKKSGSAGDQMGVGLRFLQDPISRTDCSALLT